MSDRTAETPTPAAGTPASPSDLKTAVEKKDAALNVGEVIDGAWVVRRAINEGAFGAIYEVAAANDTSKRFALKLSLTKDANTDQLAKLEIGLLRKLSKESAHFPAFQSTGYVRAYRYIVMQLLGPSLADLQAAMPDERFSINTTLRVGLQLLDFQHAHRDCGRRDDLWSFVYMLIELAVGFLPWDRERDTKRIAEMKNTCPTPVLLQGCPLMFEALLVYLDQLEFRSRPSYDFFRRVFRAIMAARGFADADPFDWEIHSVDPSTPNPNRQHSISDKAVYDQASRASQTSEVTEINSREEDEERVEEEYEPEQRTPTSDYNDEEQT
ncbi:hypothetical protein M3Y99_00258200 [Aphelenchoides fujianensis]|nr:hypothetical protein M3Y99_00258200 [Aphelenchoides fujianensis]